MNPMRSHLYPPAHLQTHSSYITAPGQNPTPAADVGTVADNGTSPPHHIPLKVAIGHRFFFPGIPKECPEPHNLQRLHSALTPESGSFYREDESGILSWVVTHQPENGNPEELLVSADINHDNSLARLVASRFSDKKILLDVGFEKDPRVLLAEKMVHTIRGKIADRIQTAMTNSGPGWQWELASGKEATVRHLSAENIRGLHTGLPASSLAPYEQQFLSSFIDKPLFITHATPSSAPVKNDDGRISLYSRQKLQERNIAFNPENTTENDITHLANDDHVFFSLESGATPQKTGSRFGDKLYRFAFDQPKVLQHATLHLVDPLSGCPPTADDRFDTLMDLAEQQPEAAEEIIDALNGRGYNPPEALFHGPHMKLGLALSILAVCRDSMPDSTRREFLQSESLNTIINGLFRPTVMIPRQFCDTPIDETNIEKQ